MDTVEIDGRLMMLQQQRDEAMNRCVILAGQIAILQKQLQEEKKGDVDGSPSRGDRKD